MPSTTNVLLIEDNNVDAQVFTRCVEAMEGWHVLRVTSLEEAEEAVEAKGTNFFHLIAVDLTLPDAVDLEAIHFARTFIPQAVCVAVTARDPREVDERALRAGAADLLVKGQMNVRGVQRAVSHAVERNTLVRRQLESERNLRSVLAAWTDALFVVADDGTVLFRNDAAATFADGVTRTEGDATVLTLDVQPGDVLQAEVRRQTGDPIPVEARAWSISWADHPARVVALRDRRAERAAARARALAELGKGAMEGVHDIRNRVTVLRDAVGRALEVVDASDVPAPLREALDTIQRNVDHIAEVAQRSRDTAHAVRKKVVLDLSALVRSCCQDLRGVLEPSAGLRLQLEPATQVLGQPADLTRVVDNLIRNAVEAIGTDAPEQHEVRVSVRQEDDTVVLEVEDDGPGIPDSIRDQVFEDGVTGKMTGTGLGLASVRRIVEAHDGTVEVTSEQGAGACFRIQLPARRARASDIRILLLEDHPDVARANVRLLGGRYAITVAHDGQEALDQLDAGQDFEVVLCDLDMPGMDGRTFFEHLGRDHPALTDRVVFCSGGAGTRALERWLRSTGRPVLTKPLDLGEVIPTIEDVAHASA